MWPPRICVPEAELHCTATVWLAGARICILSHILALSALLPRCRTIICFQLPVAGVMALRFCTPTRICFAELTVCFEFFVIVVTALLPTFLSSFPASGSHVGGPGLTCGHTWMAQVSPLATRGWLRSPLLSHVDGPALLCCHTWMAQVSPVATRGWPRSHLWPHVDGPAFLCGQRG